MVNSSGHRIRLRERFRKNGLKGFSDHEILELLLTLCIPRKDVKPQAKDLLLKFGSIRQVFDAPHESVASIKGVGESAATCLSILKELASCYLKEHMKDRPFFKNNQELTNFWRLRLGGLTHEVFEAAYLNQQYRLLDDGIERLEEGSVDKMVVYPRKIVSSALKRGASHIVIAHNHPSGDPSPSQNDLQITQTLKYVGEIVALRLLDHIIVGKYKVYSFRQAGFLE